MISFFFTAHYSLYINFASEESESVLSLLHALPIFFALFFFFFSLRLFDEVKDLKHDIQYYPERPLPKGELSKNEVLHMAFVMMVLELVIFSFYGLWSILCSLCVVIYSVFMYKEFFISEWLHSRLTTYAVTHTFVIAIMSITVFTALLGTSPTEIPRDLVYFSLANWFIFSLFEFGRKTFLTGEERAGVKSYSKIFGKDGAVLLVLLTASMSVFLVEQILPLVGLKILSVSLLILAVCGFLYSRFDQIILARTFRFLTTSYIVFIYGIILVT